MEYFSNLGKESTQKYYSLRIIAKQYQRKTFTERYIKKFRDIETIF